jgi:hypothetical protein
VPLEEEPEAFETPAPTVWPMALAFGVTLLGAGLVTNVSVSAVGLVVALVAAVGWWRQVLPVERVEWVPLQAPALRARPVARSASGVERLTPGEGGHRVRIPVEVPPFSAGIKGGIAGGIAMAVVALGYGVIGQGSLWYPVNLLAGVAMPGMADASMAQLRAFNAGALVLGVIAHGLISMLVGLLYATILPMLPRRHMLWGGLVAPLLWTGPLSALIGVINPVLGARVNWTWFVASQIAFGLAAGFVVSRAAPVPTEQTAPVGGPARPGAGRIRSDSR